MLPNLRILGVTMSLSLLMLGNPARLAAVDFGAATSYPVGTSPAAVAVGDFNGDGKLDVAVANNGSSNVSILLGYGDGTFKAATNFNAGNNPSAIAVGDFNGDGKLDLAVFQPGDLQSSRAGSVSILLGNGDGTFQAAKTLALDSGAFVMVVADFNLDMKSDLAVGDNGHVDIFIGNGDGTFQPAKPNPVPFDIGDAMAVADFNGDSKPDLAVTLENGVQILLGNGDGTFLNGLLVTVLGVGTSVHAAPVSVLAADLNHDGKADLLIGSSELVIIDFCGFRCRITATLTKFSAFLGNGDGSFLPGQVVASAVSRSRFNPHGSRIDRPFVGDFNGDGKLDLAYRIVGLPSGTAISSSLDIRLGKGDGSFPWLLSSGLENVNPLADSIAVARDLNADKLTDLIAVGTANDIDVLLNTSPTSGADLDFLSSAATPEPVGVGNGLTLAAHVLNQGPQDATGVTFTDTLPNNVNFVSATASQGSCAQTNGIVTCNVGALASAFDSMVNIVVKPTVAGTLTNTVNVIAHETDPVPSNNTATQTTTVVPVFKLTVSKTGSGSGTITTPDGGINCGAACTATYLSGTGLQVNQAPDANSVFAGWSGACTGTGACAVTMSADMTVTANFVLGEKLSVSLAGGGSGSVVSNDGAINCASPGSSCSSLYLPGANVSLTAVAAGTSVFAAWSGACTGTNANACSVTMNSVQSVTATFNPPPGDFSLVPAFASVTTQTGAQVTDVLTLTEQNGFSGSVTLTCAVTGPSPMATCNVSPSPVTLSSSSGTSTLTMTAPTTLRAFALPRNDGNKAALALDFSFSAMLLGGIGLWLGDFKKRHGLSLLLGGGVILLAVLAGCAAGNTTLGQMPQNYTVTVNATSGSLQHSTTVTLTVQ